MRKVVSAGGLIIENGRLLVVKHRDGYGFPKGHTEPGETLEQTALREVQEETALKVRLVRYVGKVNRFSIEDHGEKVNKDIELFVMNIIGKTGKEPEEEVAWVPFAEAANGMRNLEERDFLLHHAELIKPTPS